MVRGREETCLRELEIEREREGERELNSLVPQP
jgi:hypothetical protein